MVSVHVHLMLSARKYGAEEVEELVSRLLPCLEMFLNEHLYFMSQQSDASETDVDDEEVTPACVKCMVQGVHQRSMILLNVDTNYESRASPPLHCLDTIRALLIIKRLLLLGGDSAVKKYFTETSLSQEEEEEEEEIPTHSDCSYPVFSKVIQF